MEQLHVASSRCIQTLLSRQPSSVSREGAAAERFRPAQAACRHGQPGLRERSSGAARASAATVTPCGASTLPVGPVCPKIRQLLMSAFTMRPSAHSRPPRCRPCIVTSGVRSSWRCRYQAQVVNRACVRVTLGIQTAMRDAKWHAAACATAAGVDSHHGLRPALGGPIDTERSLHLAALEQHGSMSRLFKPALTSNTTQKRLMSWQKARSYRGAACATEQCLRHLQRAQHTTDRSRGHLGAVTASGLKNISQPPSASE